jgi:hypothetical protein
MKNDKVRWNDEVWLSVHPECDKIACKDCVFRDKTIVTVGETTIEAGVTKSYCEIYKYPDNKPNEILFNNSECEYYEKEKKKK